MLFKPGLVRLVGRDASHRVPAAVHPRTGRRAIHHVVSRPSCSTSSSKSIRVLHLAALRRGVATKVRLPLRTSLTSTLKLWLRNLTSSLRQSRVTFTKLAHRLPLTTSKATSQILQGALSAFKITQISASATRTAYSRLGSPFVTFARGLNTASLRSARPGALAISPLKGGLGLQTARNFSSGGARIFDNLIVNAPLALRLAGDEAEQKAKLLDRAQTPASRRNLRPTKTGAPVSTARVGRVALLTTHRSITRPEFAAQTFEEPEEEVFSYTRAQKQRSIELDLQTYFELPSVPQAVRRTELVVRLVDPLYEALGGRDPLPHDMQLSSGPLLLDMPLSLDMNTILRYEERRYMQAKTVLRVLWANRLVTSHPDSQMDLFSNPSQWRISLYDTNAGHIREVLDAEVPFEYKSWVTITSFIGKDQINDPPMSATSSIVYEEDSTPSIGTRSEEQSSSFDDDMHLLSPPASSSSLSSAAPFSDVSSLYDSRTFL